MSTMGDHDSLSCEACAAYTCAEQHYDGGSMQGARLRQQFRQPPAAACDAWYIVADLSFDGQHAGLLLHSSGLENARKRHVVAPPTHASGTCNAWANNIHDGRTTVDVSGTMALCWLLAVYARAGNWQWELHLRHQHLLRQYIAEGRDTSGLQGIFDTYLEAERERMGRWQEPIEEGAGMRLQR